jgi:hypothetical protein
VKRPSFIGGSPFGYACFTGSGVYLYYTVFFGKSHGVGEIFLEKCGKDGGRFLRLGISYRCTIRPGGNPCFDTKSCAVKNSAGYGITLAKIWKVWYKICTVKTEFQERSVMQYA